MPPPSYRLGRNDTVPLTMAPSAVWTAKPVTVPRSRASKVPPGRGGTVMASGIASPAGVVRLVSAMMISVEGLVVVRAATERFLAELSVVVRFWG